MRFYTHFSRCLTRPVNAADVASTASGTCVDEQYLLGVVLDLSVSGDPEITPEHFSLLFYFLLGFVFGFFLRSVFSLLLLFLLVLFGKLAGGVLVAMG